MFFYYDIDIDLSVCFSVMQLTCNPVINDNTAKCLRIDSQDNHMISCGDKSKINVIYSDDRIFSPFLA